MEYMVELGATPHKYTCALASCTSAILFFVPLWKLINENSILLFSVVIAFVDVPIVHFATKFWKSESHPERGTKFNIADSMLYTFLVVLTACIILFILLLIVRYRMQTTQARYEMIQQKHLGEAS